MSDAPDPPRAPRDIVRELHATAAEIRVLVDGATSGEAPVAPGEPIAVDPVVQLQRLSDALRLAGAELGLDRVLGWKMLELRDWLDSHLLAARALESADIDPTAALEMIRRGVGGIADRLPGPDDPLVAMVGSGPGG